MDDQVSRDNQLAEMIQRGVAVDPRVRDAVRLFAEASRRVPAPVMINTGNVHYSTTSKI